MSERLKTVKLSEVKKGHLMASINYVIVESKSGTQLATKDVDSGESLYIRGVSLIEECLSADQFHSEEKVTKTRAAEILTSSYNRPFTVCFDKADGEERTLRGRLVHPEPLLGRSMVEDLDLEGKNRARLVDHRTLKWLIVEGVKYIVK